MTDHLEEQGSGPKRIRIAIWTTIGCMLAGGIFAFLLNAGIIALGFTGSNSERLVVLISEGFILLPLLFILRRRGLNLRDSLRFNPIPPATIVFALLIGLGATVLLDEFDRLISIILPFPADLSAEFDFLSYHTVGQAILVLGGAAVVAAIVEEAIFRGYLQQELEAGYGDVTRAVLISSLLFGVLHFNPWWIIQIYAMALLLAYLAWRTDSIWPPVIMHSVYNAAAVTASSVPESSMAWYEWRGHVSPQWLIVSLAALTFGLRQLAQQYPVPVLAMEDHHE